MRNNTTENDEADGSYLLIESRVENIMPSKNVGKIPLQVNNWWKSTLKQKLFLGPGNNCKTTGGACNFVVIDESEDHAETLYFYSRVMGTRWCWGLIGQENCTYQRVATTSLACEFCNNGGISISNLSLVVPETGENTCGSIKWMAAGEVNGTDICNIFQKQERFCCPPDG